MLLLYGFDNELKKRFGSYLYRILLLLYCLVILLIYNNYFDIEVYIISIIAYVLMFYLTFIRSKMSLLRLFSDFLLINIFLYGKSFDLLTSTFLILPIINSQNHTGPQKSLLLYVYSICTSSFIIYNNCNDLFSITSLWVFFSLFIINLFIEIRIKVINFYLSLHDVISDFYSTFNPNFRQYKIYDSIIEKLNTSKLGTIFQIDSILCILVNSDNSSFSIVNSSEFLLDLTIEKDFKDVLSILNNKDGIVSNLTLKYNFKESNKNIFIKVNTNKKDKIFIFLLKSQNKYNVFNVLIELRDRIIISPILKPFLNRISGFFDIEYEIKKKRLNDFDKIHNEYEYVLRCINAMHFLRNRFSPIKNFISIYDDMKKLDSETRLKIEPTIEKEKETVKSVLKEILNRTDQILEGDNPYNVSVLKEIKVKVLFDIIRTLCIDNMGTFNHKNNWSLETFEQTCSFNLNGMNIILNDLIKNINKYYKTYYVLNFEENANQLIITFENDVNTKIVSNDVLLSVIEYFDSKENYGIFKMSSKGIYMIKDFLKQMQISHQLKLDNNIYTFSILLNKVQP
ncbi:MAG: hypothetical protein V4620_12145 [Bacteroidota bacterium]